MVLYDMLRNATGVSLEDIARRQQLIGYDYDVLHPCRSGKVGDDRIAFIRAFYDRNKVVAAVCHAPWLLIETGIIKERKATSYHSIKTDVISDLAGVKPDSPLAELRTQRPEATEHAQGSYAALFDPDEPEGLSAVEPDRMKQTIDMVAKTFNFSAPDAASIYRADYLPRRAELKL